MFHDLGSHAVVLYLASEKELSSHLGKGHWKGQSYFTARDNTSCGTTNTWTIYRQALPEPKVTIGHKQLNLKVYPHPPKIYILTELALTGFRAIGNASFCN